MFKFKEFIFILLTVFVVIVLVYGLSFFNNNITGKVSFELKSTYEEGQSLDGTLKIALKEGELIPASSKIVFENAGEIYEYELSKYVSDDLSSGEFYIEGKSILGTGEGYGVEGEKTIYPTVYFTLNILRESGSSGSDSPSVIKKPTESKKVSEEIVEDLEEVQEEEFVEEEISSEQESEIISESLEESQKKEKEEKSKKEKKEKTSEAEETASITGNIVSGFFSRTFNLFLRITGQVSLKLENELNGQVSGDEEFIYELEKKQTATILLGSVKTDSENLSNDKVDLDIKGNQVIVTTTYSETEKGFGQDYLGDDSKILSINLSKIDFVPKQGDLKISLVYENEEISSLKTSLIEGEIYATNETVLEVEEENEINFTQLSSLTEEEREILVTEFGNVSVEITKAEKTSQGIIVRFEIEDFWVEHYYDPEISDAKLKEQVEKDKTNFLKDLARKFSKQETQKQEIKGLVGSYKI